MTHRFERWALLGVLALLPLAGCHPSQTATVAKAPAHAYYFTCPMHPQVHETQPGNCPICGDKLVRKEAVPAASPATTAMAAPAASGPPLPPGLQEVALSPEQQVLANVATDVVRRRPLTRTLTAAGRIAYDESRRAEVTARVAGRLDALYADTTGAVVTKGQPMALIYSPDLLASMQDDLSALASYREMRHSSFKDLADGARAMRDAARQRLRLWGVSDAQIRALEASGEPSADVPLLAPATGVVINKRVVSGQYVKAGDVLYDIADLSHVWAEADVFEDALSTVHVGDTMAVRSPAFPGRSFTGKVSFVYPFLDPATRTVRVRAELANSQGLLKPAMYVTATIRAPEITALAVNAGAVIGTGLHEIVFVEVRPGVFRPREVSLGARAGDFYPVLSGLARGDRVATSGGFLLDANSQIQAQGAAPMPGMSMAPSSGSPMPGVSAASPATADAMPGMTMGPSR